MNIMIYNRKIIVLRKNLPRRNLSGCGYLFDVRKEIDKLMRLFAEFSQMNPELFASFRKLIPKLPN